MKIVCGFFLLKKNGCASQQNSIGRYRKKMENFVFFFSSPCLSQKEKEITGGQI
jgi:hypothetical protein